MATKRPSSAMELITYYFRATFSVADKSAFTAMTLKLLPDDGAVVYAVVYLNGQEA